VTLPGDAPAQPRGGRRSLGRMSTIILRAAHDACGSPDLPLRERELPTCARMAVAGHDMNTIAAQVLASRDYLLAAGGQRADALAGAGTSPL
jgi:hypothetical protein